MKIEDENEQHWWWRYLVITKVDYFFLQLCPPYLPNFFFAFSKYSVKPLSSSNKIFSCSTFRWNFQTYRLYLNLYSLILDYLMEVRKSFKFPSLFKSKNKLKVRNGALLLSLSCIIKPDFIISKNRALDFVKFGAKVSEYWFFIIYIGNSCPLFWKKERLSLLNLCLQQWSLKVEMVTLASSWRPVSSLFKELLKSGIFWPRLFFKFSNFPSAVLNYFLKNSKSHAYNFCQVWRWRGSAIAFIGVEFFDTYLNGSLIMIFRILLSTLMLYGQKLRFSNYRKSDN